MSLDVDLTKKKWVSYDEFKTHEIEYDTLYSANITHNLGEMADKAGLYEALWRPHRLIDGYNIPEEDHKAEHEFEDKQEIRAKEKGIRKAEGIEKGKKSRAEAAAAKKDSINNLSYYERAKYIEDRRAKRKEARRKKKEMENY